MCINHIETEVYKPHSSKSSEDPKVKRDSKVVSKINIYYHLTIGKINVVPILRQLSEKLHRINPLAGINSGVCIATISARVLIQAPENIKIRTIIPIKAIF